MKALTLTQPWATLVAIGAKKIETRSWSTEYRGPLAIHAAKKFPRSAKDLCFEQLFSKTLLGAKLPWGRIFTLPDLPLGAVIATCELIGVDQFGPWINERNPMLWGKGKYTYELTEQERAFGDFSFGRYGWFLANVKPLPEPIYVKGALGLWEWKDL